MSWTLLSTCILIYIRFFVNVIHSNGYNYCILVLKCFSPGYTTLLISRHISGYFDILPWLSNRHFKHNMSNTELVLPLRSKLCFSTNVLITVDENTIFPEVQPVIPPWSLLSYKVKSPHSSDVLECVLWSIWPVLSYLFFDYSSLLTLLLSNWLHCYLANISHRACFPLPEIAFYYSTFFTPFKVLAHISLSRWGLLWLL